MPGTLFKSHPKSDRRLEWRTVKADFSKIPANKNVNIEIGLGKDLDAFQKQIDAALALADDKATPTALEPLKKSAAKVKASIATLEPKAKNSTSMTQYLANLKKDADWWITTANNAHAVTGHRDVWDTEAVTVAVQGLLKLKPELDKMDVLLKDALKKTATYDPPVEVTRWPSYIKDVKPALPKITILAKDQTANHAALIKLLKSIKEPLSSLVWLMRGYNAAKFKNLPAVADWGKVVTQADAIEQLLDEPNTKIGGL